MNEAAVFNSFSETAEVIEHQMTKLHNLTINTGCF